MKFFTTTQNFGVVLFIVAGCLLEIAWAAGTSSEPDQAPQEETTADSPAATEKSLQSSSDLAKIQSLIDSEKFEFALKEIELALGSDPKNAHLHKQKGFVLRQTGQFKDAIASYLEALKINPKLHEAKEYLAVTYLKIGETKSAKVLHDELKKEAPSLAKMLENEAKKLNISL